MVDGCVFYGVASSSTVMHGPPALKSLDLGNRSFGSFPRGGGCEVCLRNSAPGRADEASGGGLGRTVSYGTDVRVGFSVRRSRRSWDGRMRRARAKVDNEQEESVSGSEEGKASSASSSSASSSSSSASASSSSSGGSEKRGGLVERIEAEMGRQFGGPLWFAVLLVSLAVFGGGYAYLIINYANFGDIPIISGPKR